MHGNTCTVTRKLIIDWRRYCHISKAVRVLTELSARRDVLHSGNVKRHQNPFKFPSFDHWAHNKRGNAHDLRFLLGNSELEVLDEISDNGLRLNEAVEYRLDC